MIIARKTHLNTHPEFIGVNAFINALTKSCEDLKEAITLRDYKRAQNPVYAHLCFATNKPGKYGYKYVLYDESLDIESKYIELLSECRKLLLAAYGFDIEKGRFSLQVHPIDFSKIDREFLEHVGNCHMGRELFHKEVFIAGMIDAGVNMGDCSKYWLQQRLENDDYRLLDVTVNKENTLCYQVANNDKILYENCLYTKTLLKNEVKLIKRKWINDYQYEEIIADCYDRLWIHKYMENDHLYHIVEIFNLIQDQKQIDKGYPSFHIITSKYITSLKLFRTEYREIVDETYINKELLQLKYLNGWIPR